MGHVKIIVDHEQIEYEGPVATSDLIKHIQYFVMERGFDIKTEKDFEHHTPQGILLEYQIQPWKIIADYARHMIRIRILGTNLTKMDIVKDGKKTKIETGKLIITLDGYIQTDLEGKWSGTPLFLFIRALYDKFIYRIYTERFEHRLTHDINQLSFSIKQFLNLYRRFNLMSEPGVHT